MTALVGLLAFFGAVLLTWAYRTGRRIDWLKVLIPVAILIVALDAWFVLEMRRVQAIAIGPVNAGADILGQKPLAEESDDDADPSM